MEAETAPRKTPAPITSPGVKSCESAIVPREFRTGGNIAPAPYSRIPSSQNGRLFVRQAMRGAPATDAVVTDTDDLWSGARGSTQEFTLSAARTSKGWLAGLLLLGIAAVLLIILGLLLSINMTRLRENFTLTKRADAVLLEIGSVQQSLLRAEGDARGYALSADPSYIVSLRAARAEWKGDLTSLRALLADDPAQLRDLSSLSALIDTRFSALERFIDLGPQGAREWSLSAGTVQARNEKNRLTADINLQLASLRSVELKVLAGRQAQTEQGIALLNSFALALAAIATICGAAGFYLLLRENHRRHTNELRMALTHTQRLALMGETAAMLAHEITQPLTAAANYLSALTRNQIANNLGPEKLMEITQKANDQIRRASEIVARLRNFIDKRVPERTVERPATLVADAVALFGTLSDRIHLETRIAPDVPDIRIDRIQIQQVLVNLMRNAIEAMHNGTRRELFLEVVRGARDTVLFRLHDTGPGLTADMAAHLFQPFTSTKKNGMGVGLSICHKIIIDHDGQIWAEPAASGGTIFCFAIPATEDQAPTRAT
jgi:two-component system sensor kinase FixL